MMESRYRILVIDDNPAIPEDIRKVLEPGLACSTELASSHAALFGEESSAPAPPRFEIDSASQGQPGVEMVRQARDARRPYSVAFVDARMPPGWDGIETIEKLWAEDSEVQVVLCTAYSDYSWSDIRARLAHPERLIILKKPFDNIEVQQLADSLTAKWSLAAQQRTQLQRLDRRLERLLKERRRDLPPADPAGDLVDQHRSLLARELALAVRRNQLTLHYQPLVEIPTRQVVSLEALLRWTHPELGSVSPAEFIPIAESSGLILPIGEFVLRSVCAQMKRWENEGVSLVPVAVNVSGAQLEKVPLRNLVRQVLQDCGLSPQWLILELTESMLVQAPRRQAQALQQLREDGVSIEIDDFGTGYSSLSCLKHLPIDALKIDRSFIQPLASSPTDEAIVCAILAMTHRLGLRAVAEGVESAAQLQVLGKYGCELAQGFYFSRPLPAADCRTLLVELTTRTSFTETLRLRSADIRLSPPAATRTTGGAQ